jgi:hypothetical protein
MTVRIDQGGASAGGDVVAGDKIVYNHRPATPGIVEQLLNKLRAEMLENAEVQHKIESLQYFYERKPQDGIVGLEAKLRAGERDHELYLALEKKELFAKLLEKWSLYASAQEIFAFFLAKVEYEYSMFIYPRIAELEQSEINQLVSDRIVVPTILECGSSVFTFNHSIVMGMVYWLAEQCFVRWHQ